MLLPDPIDHDSGSQWMVGNLFGQFEASAALLEGVRLGCGVQHSDKPARNFLAEIVGTPRRWTFRFTALGRFAKDLRDTDSAQGGPPSELFTSALKVCR